MTWVKWNLILVYLETVFALVPYGCTVCAERTIGLEIGLDAPMELLGNVGLVETCFGPFGDSASVGPR